MNDSDHPSGPPSPPQTPAPGPLCADPDSGRPGLDARAAGGRDHGRDREIRRVFLVTLALNLLVAALKGAYSLVSGSVALGTDAMHSVLDGASNILALLGLHFAQIPPDPGHPYGHRKIETLAALGIGVLIVVGVFELAQTAVTSLLGGRPPPEIGAAGFAVVLATMAINLFVTRYEHRQGDRLGSTLLCADARHTQSDLYGSAAVLLSFVAVRSGLAWADGLGGLLLVVLVGRVAWSVFRDNLPALMDAAVLDPARVTALAGAFAGVRNVHRVRSRGARGAVHLDLHMEVDPQMKVADAHDLAHRIERDLRDHFPELADVVIHVEPAA